MSKGSSQATQPVDPTALANAQTQSNIATAQNTAALSNVNATSPWGTSAFTPYTDPTTGQQRYSLNQQLSPELQDLYNRQQSLVRNLASGGANTLLPQGLDLTALARGPLNAAYTQSGNLPTGLDLSNVQPAGYLTPGSFRTDVSGGAGGQALPGVQTSVAGGGPIQTGVSSDFPTLIKQAQDAAYNQQTQYLDPQFKQGRQQLVQALADQGLQPGTEAYDRATGDFDRQQQQAYQSAQNSAVAAGNAQEQSLFGQSLGAGQFANQAQQQRFGQNVAQGQFTNQAQGQMFGQGFNLADLYNQAVTGAAGQNINAEQANLQRSQAMFGAPFTAANAQLGIGQGLFGTGTSGVGAAAGTSNLAPTWPLSIPTFGATGNIATQPTNLSDAQRAATGQNLFGFNAGQAQLSNLIGGANTGSQLLTGQNLSTLLGGSRGLFGLLGGAGAAGAGTPSAIPPALDALSTMLLAAPA
jgi:hypothetical protein